MIDLRKTEATGDHASFARQLEKEGVPYRFGEVRAGGERAPGIFLIEGKAVSLDPVPAVIENELRLNKFKTQVWHKSELRWQELELRKRLLLHR